MNIGIDIGGSHIGIGLVDLNGNIQKKVEKIITYKEKNEIENFIVFTIVDTINTWKHECQFEFEKIGIGIPGIVKNDEVKYCVNLGIKDFKLKEKLQVFFPDKLIHVKNDAKFAGLAEKNLGNLRNYKDCIFMCLGTGIGGAAFYNDELIMPTISSGFEFGHMIIQKNGDLCKCGSRGCFELYGSMRKFKGDMRYALNLPSEVDGEELLNIIKSNLDKDEVKDVIDEYIENLCIGISNIIDMFEPSAICIGGSFVFYGELLLEPLKKELYDSDYIFYKEIMPEIVLADLGNDAGIIGSALYA